MLHPDLNKLSDKVSVKVELEKMAPTVLYRSFRLNGGTRALRDKNQNDRYVQNRTCPILGLSHVSVTMTVNLAVSTMPRVPQFADVHTNSCVEPCSV